MMCSAQIECEQHSLSEQSVMPSIYCFVYTCKITYAFDKLIQSEHRETGKQEEEKMQLI